MTEQSTGDVVPERWKAVDSKSNMWMDPAQDPRYAAGAELEGERVTLLDYLRACRLALELKCAGLDAEQLARRSVPPSTMSLLGLVRHMADVARNWFRRAMAPADALPLYWSDDAEDADWAGAVADPEMVDDAWRAWRAEVAFAEQFVAGSPDLAIRSPRPDGTVTHCGNGIGRTPVKTGFAAASPTATSLSSGPARSRTPRTGRPGRYGNRHRAAGRAPRLARGRPPGPLA